MPESDATQDLQLLIAAARTAGAIAQKHFRRDPEIWRKGDDSPVTEADIAIDRVLRTDLLAARPSYGWLSEETEDDAERLGADRVFIVDPIDGTRAFIDGQDSYAHALAVAERGRVIAGVVFLPEKDKLYAAAKGAGATLNGATISAARTRSESDASILATRSMMAPEHWPGGVPPVKRVYRPSLAYRLALVAEGHFDGMATFRPTWEWDIAAGAILAEEAGATMTDGKGHALVFNSNPPRVDGVLIAPPKLHAKLLTRRGHR